MANPNVDPRLITWSNFQEAYVKDAHPNLIALGAPSDWPVAFYVTAGGRRLGLRTGYEGSAAAVTALSSRLKLRHVDVHLNESQGEKLLDVSSADDQIFEVFFGLLRSVAHRVQVERADPLEAVEMAFEEVLRVGSRLGIMSDAEQHGLFGELIVMERLLLSVPSFDLACWTGPARDSHDFRFAGRELEVKSRMGAERTHFVHSMRQLQGSPDHDLYLLSILLAESDSGATLPDLVARVRNQLPPPLHREFAEKLAGYTPTRGYRDDDAIYYHQKLVLRGRLLLVPIDESVPALTEERLRQAVGLAASRVRSLTYEVDVEGLGYDDETSEFSKVFC